MDGHCTALTDSDIPDNSHQCSRTQSHCITLIFSRGAEIMGVETLSIDWSRSITMGQICTGAAAVPTAEIKTVHALHALLHTPLLLV